MKSYPISKEFRLIRNFTPPLTTPLLPVCNLFLEGMALGVRSNKAVTITRFALPTDDGHRLPCLLIEPKGTKGQELPGLVYFHGGGFVLAAAPYHFALAKIYAAGAGCRVICPDYRLAPKHPYPIPEQDCQLAYNWTVENAERLGIDPLRIAIGGDSAGGCLAQRVTATAAAKGHAPLFQLLVYPVVDPTMATPSMQTYVDTPMWNGRLSKKMWQWYLKGAQAAPNPQAALPPTYIETAEFDCLHDEGAQLAQQLTAAGVPVTLRQTKGTVHGYDILLHAPTTRESVAARLLFMQSQFRQK